MLPTRGRNLQWWRHIRGKRQKEPGWAPADHTTWVHPVFSVVWGQCSLLNFCLDELPVDVSAVSKSSAFIVLLWTLPFMSVNIVFRCLMYLGAPMWVLQGCIVQQRKHSQYFNNNYKLSTTFKHCESLCHIPEHIILYINYTSILKKGILRCDLGFFYF